MMSILNKHDSMGTKHLNSANFIDSQRLPELNFRIEFLEQMKSGTEVDMVHHWIKVCTLISLMVYQDILITLCHF